MINPLDQAYRQLYVYLDAGSALDVLKERVIPSDSGRGHSSCFDLDGF